MNLQPLTEADLFDEHGSVFVSCCRSWRGGGPCWMPVRLIATSIPEEERQQVLNAVNQGGWSKGDDGRIYCSSCTLAMGSYSITSPNVAVGIEELTDDTND